MASIVMGIEARVQSMPTTRMMFRWPDTLRGKTRGNVHFVSPTEFDTFFSHPHLHLQPPHRKQSNSFDAVIHVQERTRIVTESASKEVRRRMQLTLHAIRRTPHGDSRLVLAMSSWSVKTRRVPLLGTGGSMSYRVRPCMT